MISKLTAFEMGLYIIFSEGFAEDMPEILIKKRDNEALACPRDRSVEC